VCFFDAPCTSSADRTGRTERVKRNQKARRLALQGLCCLDAQGEQALALVDEFITDSKEPAQVVSSACRLVREAFDRRRECDELLSRHARHWDLGRLAMVDRNILRLGVYELLRATAPYKVVISEALRLAREFSTAESPRFVNGVLDAVAREVRQKNQEINGEDTSGNERGSTHGK
jgi:transcription antitermination factor NusB